MVSIKINNFFIEYRYNKLLFSVLKTVVSFKMKRLDIIISHEHIAEVNDTLHKNKVGGMTFYDIKGRGHSKYEPVDVGRGIRRYIPEFVLGQRLRCS